ncbi:MAG: tRNA (guanosine(46)-N7)-methyltransferase TrmB [Chitinophagales bacterium]|nr:tRNA (guanosine(46)-N7)-methyltransferase TrmB [Chitinophagales bacterium]MDW8394134.1 tRNA (guanosine(46)-N7)-methyltransferase TrmB [Chitinophagales bacterium]
MGKKKLKRIAELLTFPNVYQFRADLKGKWASEVFHNSHPVTLELACGKGEYTLGLARRFPDRNFVGIDIKGPRIWRGAKTALEENLTNACFLRAYIDNLADYFATGEVQEIWIVFPDPYPNKPKAKKRLTSPGFLEQYRKILQPEGVLHLKTDDELLYEYSLESIAALGGTVLQAVTDIYATIGPGDVVTAIRTFYELQHLKAGKKIRYIRFRLPAHE